MKFEVYYSPHHDQIFVCDRVGVVDVIKAVKDSVIYCRTRFIKMSHTWVYIGEFE